MRFLLLIVVLAALFLLLRIAKGALSGGSSRKCPHCGQQVPDVGVYCPICGKK
jgi:hypothetical protein